MEQKEYNDDEHYTNDYDAYEEDCDETIDSSMENLGEPVDSSYTPYQEPPSNQEFNNYSPGYTDATQDYPEEYYQPNSYTQGHSDPHTIHYRDIRQDHYSRPAPCQDTKKLKQKLKVNNENFVMLALLASVILTSVIIGIGWSLFSPKTQEIALSEETSLVTDADKSDGLDSANDDLIIVYGSDSTENQLAPATAPQATAPQATVSPVTVAQAKASPKTPTKATPSKTAVQKTPISSANVDNTIKRSTPAKKVAAAPAQPMYWIQVFSTTNKDRSVQIKKEFENQGLTPTIITKTIGNKVYYRLRIGPYYNKSESYKFLDWVKRNPSYRDSYVSSN